VAAELNAAVTGDNPQPAGKLVEQFYPELRRLAALRMAGERINHTWQPTVLVNELYLELTRMKALPAAQLGEERQKAENAPAEQFSEFLARTTAEGTDLMLVEGFR
jgi:predicted translin family RNA/ssDNA-binding protein